MKFKENKKYITAFCLCMLSSALICMMVFRTIGAENLLGVCVSFAMGTTPSDKTISQIHLSAQKAVTGGQTSLKNKNDSQSKVTINSLAYTPDDIEALVQKAEKNYSKSDYTGKITEKTYSASSATDISGNIYVKNTTGRKIDIPAILKKNPSLNKVSPKEISVLVFHTHTTETYQLLDKLSFSNNFSPRNENENMNMVRVGKEIVSQLEEAGIGVIHDTQIYDKKYSGAYDRSGKAIDEYLKKYPSIQVVIDVHRDAIQPSKAEKIKPVAKINGKKAAQIMIITGCEGGDITDFPNWEDNLTFALHLQKTAEEMYPGLMRPVFFCNRKYNMYKTKCSLLLEMGSDANTLDEAAYSGRLIGDVLAKLIETKGI